MVLGGLSPASRRHRTGASTRRCGCGRATTAGERGHGQNSQRSTIGGYVSNPKLQIPNPNHSQPLNPKSNSQLPTPTPNSQPNSFGSWGLGWDLGIGSGWSLGFG